MAAEILSRTITTVDKRLTLANDECGRLLSIGTTWNTLRFGILLSIDPEGLTSNPAAPNFAMGLCSGTSNMYGNSTTTNWIGIRMNAALTYSAGPPISFLIASSTYQVSKKVGATITNYGNINGGQRQWSGAPGTNRHALIIEVIKGSPDWSIEMVASLNNTGDTTPSNFLLSFEQNTMTNVAAALTGSAYATHGPGSVTFDQTAGSINAINISWGLPSRTLEISHVAYARIA